MKNTSLEVEVKALHNGCAPAMYPNDSLLNLLEPIIEAPRSIFGQKRYHTVISSSLSTIMHGRTWQVAIQASQVWLATSHVHFPMKNYGMMSTQSPIGIRW